MAVRLRSPDLGGPEVLSIEELAESYLRAHGRSRRIVRVPVPGRLSRGLRAGANLAPEHADGARTWADFLATTRPND